MRTEEERIRRLHERAHEIEQHKDQICISCLSVFCVGIFALLITCIAGENGAFYSAEGIRMQGSSMLSESAGGYVLVAVLAFYAGVILTAIIIRIRKDKGKK